MTKMATYVSLDVNYSRATKTPGLDVMLLIMHAIDILSNLHQVISFCYLFTFENLSLELLIIVKL